MTDARAEENRTHQKLAHAKGLRAWKYEGRWVQGTVSALVSLTHSPNPNACVSLQCSFARTQARAKARAREPPCGGAKSFAGEERKAAPPPRMGHRKAPRHCAAAGPPGIASQEPYERAWREWAKEKAAARTDRVQRAAQLRLARALARRLTQYARRRNMPVQQDAASAAAADLLSRFEWLSVEREVFLPEAALDYALARDGCDAAALHPGVEALKTVVLEAVQVESAHTILLMCCLPQPQSSCKLSLCLPLSKSALV